MDLSEMRKELTREGKCQICIKLELAGQMVDEPAKGKPLETILRERGVRR